LKRICWEVCESCHFEQKYQVLSKMEEYRYFLFDCIYENVEILSERFTLEYELVSFFKNTGNFVIFFNEFFNLLYKNLNYV
jgi:hypothetical protein